MEKRTHHRPHHKRHSQGRSNEEAKPLGIYDQCPEVSIEAKEDRDVCIGEKGDGDERKKLPVPGGGDWSHFLHGIPTRNVGNGLSPMRLIGDHSEAPDEAHSTGDERRFSE